MTSLDRLPTDRQLARRLGRDARAAAKTQQRVAMAHPKTVARRERQRARARRALPRQLLLGLGGALASVPLDDRWAWWAMAASGVGLLGVYRSVTALARPPLPPLAGPLPGMAPPPHPASAAWPAVRRLEVVREELRRLLPLVSPAGHAVAQEAWQAAAEADAALRCQAARLSAVEPPLAGARLQDATDALQGLAQGLREVR